VHFALFGEHGEGARRSIIAGAGRSTVTYSNQGPRLGDRRAGSGCGPGPEGIPNAAGLEPVEVFAESVRAAVSRVGHKPIPPGVGWKLFIKSCEKTEEQTFRPAGAVEPEG